MVHVYCMIFSVGANAHEFIIDFSEYKESTGIDAIDVAKRLQDFG